MSVAACEGEYTGPRIPAAELDRLFQPFQRLAPQSRAHADGVGRGLAIVQAIAGAHDATISAPARIGGGLKIEASFPADETGGPYRVRSESD